MIESISRVMREKPAVTVAGGALIALTALKGNAWAQGNLGPNQTAYWEEKGYGTCFKKDNLKEKTFEVPPLPAGNKYTIAIVKAGSERSTDEPHFEDTTVAPGDILTHPSGKDLSHAILCYEAIKATVNTTSTTNTTIANTVTSTPTTQDTAPVITAERPETTANSPMIPAQPQSATPQVQNRTLTNPPTESPRVAEEQPLAHTA